MNRRNPLLLLGYGIFASLCLATFVLIAGTARATEPAPGAHLQSDGAAIMSASAEESPTLKVEIEPATNGAIPCSCVAAGAGCSGACPNAPGPRRQCRNVAPKGKGRMCSCTTDY